MTDPIVTKIATEIHDTVLKMVRVGKHNPPISTVSWLRGLTHERLGLKNTKDLIDLIVDKKPNAITECEYLLDGASNGERVMIKKRLKLMNTELDKKVFFSY
jgi:hypothetical protein|tara:strand:+ start:706 stop:1011 length:306 start_codon:yes stop_codon:yes gene_type:complete